MDSQSKELTKYLRAYKKNLGNRFYVIFSLAIASGIAESFGILMVLPLLTSLGGEGANEAKSGGALDFISSLDLSTTEILLAITVAFLLKGILLFIALSVNASLRATLLKEYKESLFNSFSRMSFSYYTSKDSGHFLNIINEQVNRTLQAFHHLTQVSVQLITAFVYILLAFFIAWRFGLMALLMGLVLSYIFKRINGFVRSLSRMSAEQNGNLSKLIIQKLGGYEYLLATGQEKKTKPGIFKSIETLSGLQKKTWIASALTQAIREPLAVVFIMVIVLIQVTYFNEPISPIIISIILFYRAMNSLLAMQTQWQFALEFIGSTELVENEKRTLKENLELQKDKELKQFEKEISFKNVDFSYEKENPIINNLNFDVRKNKSIAFVGPSGSGKSTIIKLITALVRPERGEILVDSNSLESIDIKSWRRHIGYVSQSPILFDDTILNNVSMELGTSKCDEDVSLAVKEACEKAHIAEFIESMPEGYQTRVGERGMRLSGGQRQRICIARELYRNASVLILDEATSALDSQSEKLIQQSLDELRGQITLIIIAHRLSTIKNVDEIHVMDKGKIVEKGTFSELVSTEGSQFSQLVKTQKL